LRAAADSGQVRAQRERLGAAGQVAAAVRVFVSKWRAARVSSTLRSGDVVLHRRRGRSARDRDRTVLLDRDDIAV
jgi:hypothetical protein